MADENKMKGKKDYQGNLIKNFVGQTERQDDL